MIAAYNIALQPTASLTDYAQTTLSCSKDQIMKRFADKEVNVLDYNIKGENNSEELLIEVRLDNDTLNCLIGQDGVCYETYLFLDDLDHLNACIHYCDNNYARQSFPNIWRSDDCYVSLNDYKDDLFFSFSCNSAKAGL